jgi:hypothetical protein
MQAPALQEELSGVDHASFLQASKHQHAECMYACSSRLFTVHVKSAMQIKALLASLKRPIAHFDPAMQAAHVLLLHYGAYSHWPDGNSADSNSAESNSSCCSSLSQTHAVLGRRNRHVCM